MLHVVRVGLIQLSSLQMANPSKQRWAAFIFNSQKMNSGNNRQSDACLIPKVIWQKYTTIMTGNQHKAFDCLIFETFALSSQVAHHLIG